MEEDYHLNAEEEQELGAFGEDPYQTSTTSLLPIFNTPLICIPSDYHHLKPQSPLQLLTNSTTFKLPKTEPTLSDQPPLLPLPNLRSLEENPDTVSTKLNSSLSARATRMKYDRQRELSRRRRQRVREKIESLKQLVPRQQKKRVDTATLLENTGKYIQFLEAQVSVLKCMPVENCLVSESASDDGMDRNMVLQMMVNSEVTQGKMSSQGMCVYSVEQMVQIIGRLFTTEEASLLLNSILFSTSASF